MHCPIRGEDLDLVSREIGMTESALGDFREHVRETDLDHVRAGPWDDRGSRWCG